MRPRTLRDLLLSSALFFVAACGGDTKDPGPTGGSGGSGGGSGKQEGSTCVLNSDCVDPLACVFGKCHAACAEARDCPTGSRCVMTNGGTACVLESETACSMNSDCKDPLVCAADHQCRIQCAGDRDCLPTEGCSVDHICVSK